MRTHHGILIHRAERNASGIRWFAFGPNGILRSDTLAGMRYLIASVTK
jgi:hypothetical protein